MQVDSCEEAVRFILRRKKFRMPEDASIIHLPTPFFPVYGGLEDQTEFPLQYIHSINEKYGWRAIDRHTALGICLRYNIDRVVKRDSKICDEIYATILQEEYTKSIDEIGRNYGMVNHPKTLPGNNVQGNEEERQHETALRKLSKQLKMTYNFDTESFQGAYGPNLYLICVPQPHTGTYYSEQCLRLHAHRNSSCIRGDLDKVTAILGLNFDIDETKRNTTAVELHDSFLWTGIEGIEFRNLKRRRIDDYHNVSRNDLVEIYGSVRQGETRGFSWEGFTMVLLKMAGPLLLFHLLLVMRRRMEVNAEYGWGMV